AGGSGGIGGGPGEWGSGCDAASLRYRRLKGRLIDSIWQLAISSKTAEAGRGTAASGNRAPRERAFLIGLDLRTRSRGPASPKAKSGPLTAAAQAARDSSTAKLATKAPDIPEFSAEESLAELRSLA